ncbi:MAG: 3-oxoacyl-ACP reductase FabG [Candidatus Sericytochromatia bacterium]|nr:3-oxoacyl-ACP reductase FabG [Candidatus Tanganyikabacteria bacterium]
MFKRFEGRTVLVTGGSTGIGRGIALRAAAEGAAVIVNFAHGDALAAETLALIADRGGSAIAHKADVSNRAAVQDMIDRIAVAYGRLDVLITSHGIVRRGKLAEISDAMWDDVLDLNLKGTFLACQAAAEVMLRRGQGSIVNISSMRGIEGSATSCHYAAAKAGVIALTKSLARELAPVIRVNSVAPGYVDTRIQAELTPQQREKIIADTPLKRFGSPEDIAAAALFLASDDAGFITGQTVLADGGRVTC